MADPITAAAIRGVATQGGDIASRMSELREAMTQARGGITQGGVNGGDEARRYTLDVGAKGEASFGELLTRAVNQVSEAQDRSADYVQKFLRGEPVELHQVMAAGEEAGIALELLVEMRNKLTEAYRTVMSMQS